MNVPRLRFNGFSEDWKKKTVDELVNSKIIYKPLDGNHGELHPKATDFVDLGIPFIMANDIKNNAVNIDEAKKIRKQQADKLQKGFSKEGDVLLTHKGSVGFVAVVPKLSTEYIMLTPQVTYYRVANSEILNNKFLAFSFITPNFQKELLVLASSGTRAYIGITEQRLLKINLPTIPEQTKIANFLKAVDEKIAQLTQKGDLLARYKKGVMQQIFRQQLRFKDDDGREFPDWEEKKLVDVATIVGGGTPDTTINEYWNGNIQWFTPTEIKTKYANKSQRTITESGLKNSSAKILPIGTLLFSSRATVGDVSIALNECTTNQGFQSLIVKDENINQFIYYWILNNKSVFLEKASGSTFLEISKKEIEKLKIKIPTLPEQTKIANFLTALDDKITYNQTQLNALKQYKQGLLQQMFV